MPKLLWSRVYCGIFLLLFHSAAHDLRSAEGTVEAVFTVVVQPFPQVGHSILYAPFIGNWHQSCRKTSSAAPSQSFISLGRLRLKLEQRDLVPDAAAVADKRAVRANDAVAGDDDADGVPADRAAHRLGGHRC